MRLLAVATRLLALSDVAVRRRAVQDEIVCAFDRLPPSMASPPASSCARLPRLDVHRYRHHALDGEGQEPAIC